MSKRTARAAQGFFASTSGRQRKERHKSARLVLAIVLIAPFVALQVPSEPAGASAFGGVTAVATGQDFSLALRSDGTVWSWGKNQQGQLGDGTTSDRHTPVQVSGLSNVIAIAAGWSHSLALRSDGTVWAWGANGAGQLGDGSTTSRSAPVQVTSLTAVSAIAAGDTHSLALQSTGSVRAWGANLWGQLGDGTTTTRLTPVTVSGISTAVAIAAGGSHSLAALASGSVRSWGANDTGQLGDGTATNRLTPVTVSGVSGVSRVAAGIDFSLALLATGALRAWGGNDWGQLGDGTTTSRLTPVTVSGISSATSVAAGSSGSHGLAVLANGSVRSWGQNFWGQLGDGTTTNRSTPVAVSGLTNVTAASGNESHSLAVLTDGSARSWGANGRGQLGTGTTTSSSTPVTVMTTPATTTTTTLLPPVALLEVESEASASCDSGMSIVDGFVGDVYTKVRTAEVAGDRRVCLRVDGPGLHEGGHLVVGGGSADPPGVDSDVAACETHPDRVRLASGTIGPNHEPYQVDLVVDTSANEAWLCITATNSVRQRVIVPVGLPGLVSFVRDEPGDLTPEPVPAPAAISGTCQAAGGARVLNADVAGTNVWLYFWEESVSQQHLCVRTNSSGGRFSLDPGAEPGVSPAITTVSGPNALDACPINIIDQSDPVKLTVKVSNPGVPASVCIEVGGAARRITLGADGGATIVWEAD